MKKENIEKITTPLQSLNAKDISVEEKKSLSDFMQAKGFSVATFYLRFFKNGFSVWEIIGVNECKKQFLTMPEVAELLLSYAGDEEQGADKGDKGYLYTLAKSDKVGAFYECLRRANTGLCKKFFDFMNERGMSTGTVIKRFTTDNWKEWESNGIKNCLFQFNLKPTK